MFKNILIVILFISTGVFSWLAIRNSTPLQCSDIVELNDNTICIMDLGKHPKDIQTAIKQIQEQSWKYNN